MRIAYLGQMADVATENGISKKIRTQAHAWMREGHTVRYFALRPDTRVWQGMDRVDVELLARGTYPGTISRSLTLCSRIRRWSPDLIFFRYAYHSPGLPRLFRGIPTIAEINSDDLTEYGLTLSWPKRLYHRLTRKRVLQPIQAFTPVTHELARRFAYLQRPMAVIGNSIDLREFEPLPPCDAGAAPRLVFVGSGGTPWHGLTRIGSLARLLIDVTIDVIGCDASDWNAAGAGVPPPNVRLHGALSLDRYLPLMAGASVAIGTLGLFEKRMEEACPLKVREYLALGLPVIAGYQDTDIPAEADYFLRLPNNAAPLGPWKQTIIGFIDQWHGRRVPRSAVAHLDVSAKETARLAFMATIAGSRHA